MKISIKEVQGICLISISGRIDSRCSVDLERALYKAISDSSRIVIDLADTQYISSSGLRVLLAGKKRLDERGGEMILLQLQPVVRDVFEIAGLGRMFLIKKSWEDALSAIKTRPKLFCSIIEAGVKDILFCQNLCFAVLLAAGL